LAAVLRGKHSIKGRQVVAAASGGNVNRETFSQALATDISYPDQTEARYEQ
jgi:threonine dehydratase